LIATEYSFSASAGEIGTREAFLKFIADDAVLFAPNPVNGKKHFEEDKQPRTGLLSWYPCKAFISKSGDMGFSSGPWEWKKNKNDSSASAYGNFCTVWQKQNSGKWKFVFDMGINNDKPITKIEPLAFDTSKKISNPLIKGIKHSKPTELLQLEKQFSTLSFQIGAAATYRKYIDEDSRLLRDGVFPIVGKWNITDYLSQKGLHYQFNPVGGKISSSKDFGFTYGELAVNNSETNSNEKFNYLRIWKKEGNRWIIVSETANKLKS
jgi:ketosteroid isomerase-like protein